MRDIRLGRHDSVHELLNALPVDVNGPEAVNTHGHVRAAGVVGQIGVVPAQSGEEDVAFHDFHNH